tara:strand:- start:420 stop:839 length:420 start_codon:yes stop_codon:yes gene_type:complete
MSKKEEIEKLREEIELTDLKRKQFNQTMNIFARDLSIFSFINVFLSFFMWRFVEDWSWNYLTYFILFTIAFIVSKLSVNYLKKRFKNHKKDDQKIWNDLTKEYEYEEEIEDVKDKWYWFGVFYLIFTSVLAFIGLVGQI